ncbi:alpha/beta fold hydrolase [Isoptericola sp. NPDC056605]|uniref:alpha/beta fold hydrolase n=1 Tax=Isoptericola sp. NPDC056605 TaxID=3345876 RepID=UPI00368ACE67
MERTLQKWVTVRDGGRVAVDVYGEPDDDAIVLVPGVLSDAAAWGPVARALEGWATVAVVNRRGRHPSSPLPTGYSLRTELDDLAAVLRGFTRVRTLFGWSYGGLIALHLAGNEPVPHVVAYDPVARPFGADALAALGQAAADEDDDATVEIVLGRVSRLEARDVAALRADPTAWATMTRLAAPVHAETAALNATALPEGLAGRAGRVDLVVGGAHRGRPPYGTTFDDVRRVVPHATTHVLPGQGHLAHLDAPRQLAAWITGTATVTTT